MCCSVGGPATRSDPAIANPSGLNKGLRRAAPASGAAATSCAGKPGRPAPRTSQRRRCGGPGTGAPGSGWAQSAWLTGRPPCLRSSVAVSSSIRTLHIWFCVLPTMRSVRKWHGPMHADRLANSATVPSTPAPFDCSIAGGVYQGSSLLCCNARRVNEEGARAGKVEGRAGTVSCVLLVHVEGPLHGPGTVREAPTRRRDLVGRDGHEPQRLRRSHVGGQLRRLRRGKLP